MTCFPLFLRLGYGTFGAVAPIGLARDAPNEDVTAVERARGLSGLPVRDARYNSAKNPSAHDGEPNREALTRASF